MSYLRPTLSIIVPVYDDQDAFLYTLKSLAVLPSDFFEIVVSDSSTNRKRTKEALTSSGVKARVTYIWTEPNGTYPAFNRAIQNASGRWVYIIGSGDALIAEHAERLVRIVSEPPARVLLFQVLCTRNNKPIFVTHVDEGSALWPHQGFILEATIHNEVGLYSEKYKATGDQFFMHEVRKRYAVVIYDFPVAKYDLGGRSSASDLRIRKEFWLVRKLYGVHPLKNFIWSYVRPIVRGLLDRYLSSSLVDAYLKRRYGA